MADQETPPYRGGCVKGMPVGRDGQPGCHARCLHRSWVQEYRDSRDAWAAWRESGTPVDVPGGAGAVIAAYQLEDDQAAEVWPPPTLREWMENRRTPDQEETR